MRGNCYVTCEALYHLLGGKKANLKPMTLKHEGDTHWFLVQTCLVSGSKEHGHFFDTNPEQDRQNTKRYRTNCTNLRPYWYEDHVKKTKQETKDAAQLQRSLSVTQSQ